MAKSSPVRKPATPAEATASADERAKKIEEIIGTGPRTGTKYLPEGFRRKNLLMHKDHLYKLKSLCYWDNIHEYEAMYMIMEEYFKGRKIKDIPARRSIIPRK